MRVRSFFPGLLAIALSGCCDAPQDPAEPAGSGPALAAEAFLRALARREDAAAFGMLAPIQQHGWDVAGFTAQVDAVAALRSGDAVTWTRVHYVPQESSRSEDVLEQCVLDKLRPVEVEGTLGSAQLHLRGNRDIEGGWLWNGIQVDGRHIAAPDPRPRRSDGPKPGANPN
jgi:hypothetical protein